MSQIKLGDSLFALFFLRDSGGTMDIYFFLCKCTLLINQQFRESCLKQRKEKRKRTFPYSFEKIGQNMLQH